MICIACASSQYIVRAADKVGQQILSQPLHRIFLRSNVGAMEASDGTEWRVTFEPRDFASLEKIIHHFSKYRIQLSFDDACRERLAILTRRRERFEQILAEGRIAKGTNAVSKKKKQIEVELSGGFRRRLTPLQIAAVNHLLTVENGANFSVPGAGKTSVALACYHLLKERGLVDALLVIGPASCFEPWESEYKLCFQKDSNSVRLAGLPKTKRRDIYLTAERYEFLLTTYHSAANDVADLSSILRRRRYLLILDESHYVKRPQGGKLAEAVLTIAQHTARRAILTGTPMPNGLPDLWSQFTFLWFDQKPLGTAQEYLIDLRRGDEPDALRKVRRLISPLFFRITKSQLDLPRPSFRLVKCEMSALQSRIYKGVAAKFLAETSESPTDREALRNWRRSRAIRLLQIASNPTLLRHRSDEFQLPAMDTRNLPLGEAIEHYSKYERPSKVDAACNLVRKITSGGEKVIIWSVFVHNLQMIGHELKDLGPVIIHGGVPLVTTDEDELSRESLIYRFRNDSSCKVLIANPAACAESISLHKICHHAVYLDRSFNCAHYLQSLDRIHRLGLEKDKKTFYYILQSRDSIDEVIGDRLKEKMNMMRDVIEADLPGEVPGYWSEDLGDEEILDLQLVETHIKSLFRTK